MGQRVRLDRQAWGTAALAALAEGGLAAVAVEPLAARLGATKGSFYSHFANRDELIAAAVSRWEVEGTEQVIHRLSGLPDPATRLRALFAQVFWSGPLINAELALLADADHPLVAPALARVTARRVAYLREQFVSGGASATSARHRAVACYSAFVGLHQADRAAAGALFHTVEERAAYLDFLLPLFATGP
jgi:AcrR family transcriptional regulator